MHYPDSIYDDLPESRYHYPAQYRSKVEKLVGDYIVYYEPGKQGRFYKAIAKVLRVEPDMDDKNKSYAIIQPQSYIPFERLVPLSLEGVYFNRAILDSNGRMNPAVSRSAVQIISNEDFAKIVNYGLPESTDELPRVDDSLEVADNAQTVFSYDDTSIVPREFDSVLINRKRRDRAFRSIVLKAYDKKCAFTGMRFINGGGRAEVQAAHIRPVEFDGPDSVSNGMALSGTIHWMFDRGLLSIGDDFEILVSRHINNVDEVDRLLVKNRQAHIPLKMSDRPHPDYLRWHREKCFKT